MTEKAKKKQEILDAFQFRHATKEYDNSKKITDEDFNFILETGRLSPSSFGFEPWKFLIVQSSDFREKLMKLASGAEQKLSGASHFVIILARVDVQYDSEYVANHLKTVQQMPDEVTNMILKGLKLFQENFWQLTNDRSLFDWSSKQTYIALANMMTAAAQIGIDSTPIEGFIYKDVYNLLESEGLLEEGRYKPSVMAAFGYRKKEPNRLKARKSLNEIVEWL
ncbi:NAD(P)H-dependent oxidoreductase [Oceanobacillus kimchii]|uniref:NAD(P)H nitroreductase YfkO n=1 Tax=Oceanobacillus kimchii TaxID=746691 RepID=A0ABQ5TP05_9BACI|nr:MULTISPECIES: NAD(P)H-dependent oxidoreductase [Oceanobacillus]MBT2599590.1 NAD(P)H-dependent oxidoreductase [Oceanobacillus sp. ISL-74]MCT1576776.1 NAD(P)H-dependent oxidoreductase [Oceanobacillus kimchii]MCT2134846.1 NAD(P)H-dependent oxidoreductase [Oceanobacillus kimchii]OEH56140.1 NAD(P)H-dependent oxidoreductase [Oceanobacillus sp. E9]GLO67815.1 putative NAD(P)H nitroreductase YfkO [Oceanobacillus kimchii]